MNNPEDCFTLLREGWSIVRLHRTADNQFIVGIRKGDDVRAFRINPETISSSDSIGLLRALDSTMQRITKLN